MAENKTRRLVVIGAGPGGYAAAFHAADLGLSVTLIDKESNPGGVCLYRGCIPTKAVLHAAKLLNDTRKAKDMGLDFADPTIDVARLRAWKNSIIEKLTQGLGYLAKKRKIEYIQGTAAFLDSHTVQVKTKNNETQKLAFEQAVLATGARPATLPIISPDLTNVMDSTGALELQTIPASMLVIGGGYIGLELGSAYAAFGTKVTIVEMTAGLMPGSDPELIKILKKRLDSTCESIMLNTKVAQIAQQGEGLKVAFEGADREKTEVVYDQILYSVGRRPNTKDIGLEKTAVQVDDKGVVSVDTHCRTADDAIYAIGDITGAPQLAHRATHQGIVAAACIAGKEAAFEPRVIPFVEYTDPEVAECGLSEKQAAETGRNIKVTRFPWKASGRALTLNENEGLTKLIIDADTEQILGAGIVGAGAGELISEAALAVEMAAVAGDLAMTIHPHPTLSETLMEAAAIFTGHAVNI
jgi:dihydrolipoamide dehydrogenase